MIVSPAELCSYLSFIIVVIAIGPNLPTNYLTREAARRDPHVQTEFLRSSLDKLIAMLETKEAEYIKRIKEVPADSATSTGASCI